MGFRLVFVILLCVNIAELAGLGWNVLHNRLSKGTRI